MRHDPAVNFPPGTPDGGTRTATVVKALAVRTVLAQTGEPMRLSEVSRRAGLAKSTTYRMLGALLASGLVDRVGNDYRAAGEPQPGPAGVLAPELLRTLAPFVADLYVRTGLTSVLAVADGTEVAYMRQVHSHDDVWTRSDEIGRACVFHCAAGQALLAAKPGALAEAQGLTPDEYARLVVEVSRVRRTGFAAAAEEGAEWLAVAVPLRGGPPLALAVKGPAPLRNRERVLFSLTSLARAASEALRSAITS